MQPAFAVYRNTVLKGCVDALLANYPAVLRLTGESWLRAAAADFARVHPPPDARLCLYGEGFAEHLLALPTLSAMPWIADVARLDRLWTHSYVACDAQPLRAQDLAGLDSEQLAALPVQPHPATRWVQTAQCPAATLWQRSRTQLDEDQPLEWVSEALLLTRPGAAVLDRQVRPAVCHFLDACVEGAPLGHAAAQTLARDAGADVAAVLAELLDAGALSLVPSKETP